jgi:hypothetical protein
LKLFRFTTSELKLSNIVPLNVTNETNEIRTTNEPVIKTSLNFLSFRRRTINTPGNNLRDIARAKKTRLGNILPLSYRYKKPRTKRKTYISILALSKVNKKG